MKRFITLFAVLVLMPVIVWADTIQWQDIPVGEATFQDSKIVKAYRETGTAHSYFVLLFLSGEHDKLSVIPFRREDGKFVDSVQTEQGADCITKDFKISPYGDHILEISRPVKSGYDQPEQFTFYLWSRVLSEALPGSPDQYWSIEKSWVSTQVFCDANAALLAELKK